LRTNVATASAVALRSIPADRKHVPVTLDVPSTTARKMRRRHVSVAEFVSQTLGPGKSRFGRFVEWNFDAGRQP
jgi:hypothetical protein